MPDYPLKSCSMIALPGIAIEDKIYESSNSLVYRGIRDDGVGIVVKMLKLDYPCPQELTRYRQEYKITRSLKIRRSYQSIQPAGLSTHSGDSLRRFWGRVPREMDAQAPRYLLPHALIHFSRCCDRTLRHSGQNPCSQCHS